MKNNMALKWEKVQEKAKTKVEINFKKRWIPFLFEFAQKDLSKMNNLLPYLKAIAFLSSNPNEEFHLFDEDSFDSGWRRDFEESGYVSTDLGVVQAEVCKVLKYMERKNLPDLSVPVILYHANIISGFYVNNRGFLIEHILVPPHGVNVNSILRAKALLTELQECLVKAQKEKSVSLLKIIPLVEQIEKTFSEMELKIDENQRVGRSVAWLLCRMLDGLPLDSIRKCKGCHHYFLHTSKRKSRLFCTPSCAGRSIQREKREELRINHPRKYKAFLKKQKEIMRHRRSR